MRRRWIGDTRALKPAHFRATTADGRDFSRGGEYTIGRQPHAGRQPHTEPGDSMSQSESLADLRREYARARLDEEDVSHDPIVEFARWFADAQAAHVEEPNAMVLATTSSG